jgi:hypothetical protein
LPELPGFFTNIPAKKGLLFGLEWRISAMAKLTSEPPQVVTYNLQLSKAELKVLFSLLSKTSGDPNTTYRKFTKQVYDEIQNFTDWDCTSYEFTQMFVQKPIAGDIK